MDNSRLQTAELAIWGFWIFSDFVVDKPFRGLRSRDFGPVRTCRCYHSHALSAGPFSLTPLRRPLSEMNKRGKIRPIFTSLVRSRGCLGQASGQVLHGHLHDTYRITLKISHLNRWQYSKRFRQHVHRRRLLYCVSVSGVTY